MKKGKLISMISALIVSIAVLITITYAWYVKAVDTDSMRFSITQINSNVVLYEAYDINYNGVPDKTGAALANKYYNDELKQNVGYQLRYYEEKYYFKYLDQRYALSDDSTSNLLNTIIINDIAPTKVYTYKYELINYAGVENKVNFAFEEDMIANLSVLKYFEARIAKINADGTREFGEWVDFTDGENYSGIELNPGAETMTIPSNTKDFNLGRLDVWLQIRIKPSSTIILDHFELPQYRITLSYDAGE